MQILNIDNAPECQENFFTLLKDKITSLDHHSTLAFGNLEYGKDFTRYYYPPEKEGAFGKTLYKLTPAKEGEEPSELSVVFFGEICPSSFGTTLSAKGNHYAGTAENPKVLSFTINLPYHMIKIFTADNRRLSSGKSRKNLGCLIYLFHQ